MADGGQGEDHRTPPGHPPLPGPSEPWFVRSAHGARLIRHLDPAGYCDEQRSVLEVRLPWWRRAWRWVTS